MYKCFGVKDKKACRKLQLSTAFGSDLFPEREKYFSSGSPSDGELLSASQTSSSTMGGIQAGGIQV